MSSMGEEADRNTQIKRSNMDNWELKDAEDRANKEAHLKDFLKGDEWAIKLCMDVWDLFQVWDDLVDKTHDRTEQEITRSFRTLMVELPKNPFYREYAVEITTILNLCVMQWTDANKLERAKGGDHRNKAYVLRACIFNLYRYCAYLVGGQEWADSIGPVIWDSYGETLEGFLKEMEDEFKQC